MAVANDTIIQKMINELNQARAQKSNQANMVKHIANVRLLCDLFLDEESSADSSDVNEISAEEMKAMIGTQATQENQVKYKKSTIDHDEANGDSLFDF